MVEVCRDLNLTQKTLGSQRRGQFGPQDLHSDLAVVLEVLGQVDRGHATTANLLLDGVAVCEGGLETVEKVWHCVLALLATVLE